MLKNVKMRVKFNFSNDLEEITNEYKPSDDPFCDDDEMVYKIKKIIFTNLSSQERNILLLYCEYKSLRKVATKFNVSTGTVYNYIISIKNKIKMYINDSQRYS